MAIDDNTTYGLKGSQVKDLAAKLMTSEDVSDQITLNTIFDTAIGASPVMRKIGKLVWLSFPYIRIKVATQANSWFNVATIPQSLAPVSTIEFIGSEMRESDGAPVGIFRMAFTSATTIQAKAQAAVSLSGSYSSAMSFNVFWLIS